MILALAECLVWLNFFFVSEQRGTPGVVLIAIFIAGSIAAVGALFFQNKMAGDYSLRLVVISLANIFVLIVILFGYLYWGFGTRANFNITLRVMSMPYISRLAP